MEVHLWIRNLVKTKYLPLLLFMILFFFVESTLLSILQLYFLTCSNCFLSYFFFCTNIPRQIPCMWKPGNKSNFDSTRHSKWSVYSLSFLHFVFTTTTSSSSEGGHLNVRIYPLRTINIHRTFNQSSRRQNVSHGTKEHPDQCEHEVCKVSTQVHTILNSMRLNMGVTCCSSSVHPHKQGWSSKCKIYPLSVKTW